MTYFHADRLFNSQINGPGARHHADVCGNTLLFPPKTKNNFSGIDTSQPTPSMSLSVPSFSLDLKSFAYRLTSALRYSIDFKSFTCKYHLLNSLRYQFLRARLLFYPLYIIWITSAIRELFVAAILRFPKGRHYLAWISAVSSSREVSGERRLKALGDNAVRWRHESNVVNYEISHATFSAKTSLDKTVKFWWTSIISARPYQPYAKFTKIASVHS